MKSLIISMALLFSAIGQATSHPIDLTCTSGIKFKVQTFGNYYSVQLETYPHSGGKSSIHLLGQELGLDIGDQKNPNMSFTISRDKCSTAEVTLMDGKSFPIISCYDSEILLNIIDSDDTNKVVSTKVSQMSFFLTAGSRHFPDQKGQSYAYDFYSVGVDIHINSKAFSDQTADITNVCKSL